MAEQYTRDDTSSPAVVPLQVSPVVCCLGIGPHPWSYRAGDGDVPYFPLLNRWALGLEKQAHIYQLSLPRLSDYITQGVALTPPSHFIFITNYDLMN